MLSDEKFKEIWGKLDFLRDIPFRDVWVLQDTGAFYYYERALRGELGRDSQKWVFLRELSHRLLKVIRRKAPLGQPAISPRRYKAVIYDFSHPERVYVLYKNPQIMTGWEEEIENLSFGEALAIWALIEASPEKVEVKF